MVDVDVNPDEIISELSQWIEEDRKVDSNSRIGAKRLLKI